MQDTLLDVLRSSATDKAVNWLVGRLAEQEKEFKKRAFYFAFSGVSRHFDRRAPAVATPEQAKSLAASAPGFTIEEWDQFRLARVILMLSLVRLEKPIFLETFAALLNTADFREQAAIFSAFPLFPHQEDLIEAAVDGLRSNIIDVFDSIALGNPFPASHFTDEAWNQMVLKAIFINRPLFKIIGIDTRRNEALAKRISDLAHERWAAGRKLTPEAWRNCVGFLDDDIISDLKHLVKQGDLIEREAVALVTTSDQSDRIRTLSESLEAERDAISDGSLTWKRLGEKLAFQTSLNGTPSRT